ncbi:MULTISPECIES: type II secretion system F family protein [Auritidibacter]|uniref:Type II secretion system F family protein n=1 Tax=Auritidibacter ignavus TaxID=678932 RepID=A0AAJ6DCN7_9MICC|nr:MULTISPECIES: type II secretion system F family protein [Auritidibacter]PXA75410.1 secretion system protein [Auritidibacter sp. NML120779]AXR74895.1 type II secretion system F family protein [Auritidibacter sp. NML130574]NIH71316.1 pilus assembly protein TadC [Auritidibacter ignavus]PXA78264.1 secretion system protein [Auritidibacter sp. NML100628]RMX23507.1 type II secretion system F family protein [Auritidibacter ignavus]
MSERSRDYLDPALAMDLLAALLSSGIGLASGLQHIGTRFPQARELSEVGLRLHHGFSWQQAWEPVAGITEYQTLAEHLYFPFTAAVPSATVIRGAASSLRRHRQRAAEKRAAELGIKLVVPMGVCLLPSFICLGVMPLVITLFPDVMNL